MKKVKNPILKISFLICFVYWSFIACHSEMIFLHDSIGYEFLGKLILNNGWIEYFRNGPNREPFYPFLISLSMKIGNSLSISFQTIQIFIQIFLLFLTQIFTLKILELLNINKYVTALTILYIGISPALINSTFCLYSEIASFPFMPGLVLLIYLSIKALKNPTLPTKKINMLAAGLGGTFLLITFTKAIFEVITPTLLFLTFLISISLKPKQPLKIIFIFFLIASATFYIPLTAYKYCNYKYNGNFDLTDRGAWALYGNTERRMIPLTKKRFLAALSYVGGQGVCQLFFNNETCTEWSYVASDHYGASQRQLLERQKISTSEINHQLLVLAFKKAVSNPPQYILLWFIEGMKMLVWESLDMAYVLLSNALLPIYNFIPLKMGLFFTMPILILTSLIYSGWFIISNFIQKLNLIFNDDKTLILLIILLIIFIYISLYSFFFILARYAFTLGSLYFILIAFSLDQFIKLFRKKA